MGPGQENLRGDEVGPTHDCRVAAVPVSKYLTLTVIGLDPASVTFSCGLI